MLDDSKKHYDKEINVGFLKDHQESFQKSFRVKNPYVIMMLLLSCLH